MSLLETARFVLFPHRLGHLAPMGAMDGMVMEPAAAEWRLSTWLVMVTMWWSMMIAMMVIIMAVLLFFFGAW